MNTFLIGFSVVLFLVQPAAVCARSGESSHRSDELSVSVIETVDGATQILRKVKVTLLVGSEPKIAAYPAEWQDIPVDEEGVAWFSGVRDGVAYSLYAWAPGYLSEMREFTREGGKPEHLSIVLEKAPLNLTGSVRVEVLVQAAQAARPVTIGQIQILMEEKVIASSSAKIPTGKQGVVFSDLPIGDGYEVSVIAPGYDSQRMRVAIQPDLETPVQLILTRSRRSSP